MTDLDHSNKRDVAGSNPGASVRKIGLAQRRLLWAVLASFGGLLFPLAMFVTIPFQLHSVYKLAKALNLSTGASTAWLLAMFIRL